VTFVLRPGFQAGEGERHRPRFAYNAGFERGVRLAARSGCPSTQPGLNR
jgi:hypothetical protein